MLTKQIAINTIKEFICKCETEQVTFSKVILFGSVVNGNINANSDIDVLLVSDMFGYSKWQNAKLIARIHKKYNIIDAHTYPTHYFEQGDPFINEVLKTEIKIIV